MAVVEFRRTIGAALAGFASAALLVLPFGAGAGAASTAPSYAFHFLAFAEDGSADADIASVCGATSLGGGIAITAAHCLFDVAVGAPLACISRTGSVQTRFERILLHPTHDIALFRLAEDGACAHGGEAPELGLAGNGPYHVWTMAPREPSRVPPSAWRAVRLPVAQVESGDAVLYAHIDRDCPLAGDSGTGLFSENGPRTHLHGLLIGSPPGCPSRAVFVRLDPVQAWIEDRAKLLAEESER